MPFFVSLFCCLKILTSYILCHYWSIETALIIGRVKPFAFSASIIIFSIQWLTLPNFKQFIFSFSHSNLGEIIAFPQIRRLILSHAHANIFWSSVTLINEVSEGSNGDKRRGWNKGDGNALLRMRGIKSYLRASVSVRQRATCPQRLN